VVVGVPEVVTTRRGAGVTVTRGFTVTGVALSAGSPAFTVPVSFPVDVGATVSGITIGLSFDPGGIGVTEREVHVTFFPDVTVQVHPVTDSVPVIDVPGGSVIVTDGSW
jgi:hypothetical protein